MTPGRFLVGSKLEQLIENEPIVEKLEEVTSREDGEDDVITPEITPSGQIRIRKGAAKKTAPPKDGEGLRAKYQLICNAWLFARTRYSNRHWIMSATKSTFNDLAEYILGELVNDLQSAKLGPSQTTITPDWDTVLGYEYELRKHAYKLVREGGLLLDEALAMAMKHEETRSIHLTAQFHQQVARFESPTDVNSKGEGSHQSRVDWSSKTLPWLRPTPYFPKKGKEGKGKQPGKGVGKNGKVHGQGGKTSLYTKMPGGQLICFGYNNGECTGDCDMAHACQRCRQSGHAKGSAVCAKGASKGSK